MEWKTGRWLLSLPNSIGFHKWNVRLAHSLLLNDLEHIIGILNKQHKFDEIKDVRQVPASWLVWRGTPAETWLDDMYLSRRGPCHANSHRRTPRAARGYVLYVLHPTGMGEVYILHWKAASCVGQKYKTYVVLSLTLGQWKAAWPRKASNCAAHGRK